MKKILFIDRDGTLVVEPEVTQQINALEELYFLPWVISSLKKLKELWYIFIIVTNQDGLWTIKNPLEMYEKINTKIFDVFLSEQISFDKIFVCPHFESENCNCRKPNVGILGNYLWENQIDYENSYMIWDRETDMEFAKNIGISYLKVVHGDIIYNWGNVVKEILK